MAIGRPIYKVTTQLKKDQCISCSTNKCTYICTDICTTKILIYADNNTIRFQEGY